MAKNVTMLMLGPNIARHYAYLTDARKPTVDLQGNTCIHTWWDEEKKKHLSCARRADSTRGNGFLCREHQNLCENFSHRRQEIVEVDARDIAELETNLIAEDRANGGNKYLNLADWRCYAKFNVERRIQ